MKNINISDLQKIQMLKQGESLISSGYIITCTEPQKSYVIEFYRVAQ